MYTHVYTHLCLIGFCVSIVLNCTQETYDDAFFEALDGVTNALDNVDASESVITLYVHHRMYCIAS